MPSSFRDRRQTPRIDTAIRVEPIGEGATLYAQDVSLGGMLVTTIEPRWPGSLLRVRFRLPQQKQFIRATLRVLDLVETPRGVGLSVQFLRLSAEAQLAVHQYVDSRPSPSFADFSITTRVQSWIRRIVDDCCQLQALAKTSSG